MILFLKSLAYAGDFFVCKTNVIHTVGVGDFDDPKNLDKLAKIW